MTSPAFILADNVGGATAALERVKADDLPDELKGKDKATQAAVIATNQAKRATVQKQITELAKKRDAHLADEAKKAPAAPKDAFDSEVKTMVRAEGNAVGLTW